MITAGNLLLILILLFIGAGCNQTPPGSPTSESPSVLVTEPSPIATQSPMSVANLEAMNRLELPRTMPTTFPEDELYIINGDLRLNITSLTRTDRIHDTLAPTGTMYLILDGFVFNHGVADQLFNNSHLIITAMGTSAQGVSVNRDLTRIINIRDYTYRWRFHEANVPARRVRPVVAVFEVPDTWDAIRIHFFEPIPRPYLEVLLIDENEAGILTAWKVQEGRVINGQRIDHPLYAPPRFNLKGEEVSRLHDSQPVHVDNCFGAGEISFDFTYETESLDFARELLALRIMAQGEVNHLAYRAMLETEINAEKERIFAQTLRERRRFTASVPAGKRSLYQADLYFVTQYGDIIFEIGGTEQIIPYTLENRLRFDVQSVEAEPCPSTTR